MKAILRRLFGVIIIPIPLVLWVLLYFVVWIMILFIYTPVVWIAKGRLPEGLLSVDEFFYKRPAPFLKYFT